MDNLFWVARSLVDLPRKEDEKMEIIRFLNEVYSSLLHDTNKSEQGEKSKSEQYKDSVFDILHNAKARLPLSTETLINIQMKIEDLTMRFDEESMFKSAPNIIRILIKNNESNAKDYLRGRELEKDDIELLTEFGQYTIEALIVHVLGMVFHSQETNSLIRVASLVEQLESSLRIHASLLKSRRCKKVFSTSTDNDVLKSDKEKKRSKLVKKYPFGSALVQFMEDRELISLVNDLSGSVRVQNKKGNYYLPSHLYAECNFDISLLPIKLNLPMVCEPLDWKRNCPPDQKPIYLSDLSGGYLSEPTKEIYDRYRLLSSVDINNFYIDIGDNHQKLCFVMNKLQRQAFQINSEWLKYIQENENTLVEYGLLMPRFLASINIKDVSRILRELHMKDEVINKLCSFNELLNTICKNIQRARYEKLIIDLAIAYEGFDFYLPAFLDFRGRIYRCGVLHFHERDLARSLIVFADCKSTDFINKYTLIAASARS